MIELFQVFAWAPLDPSSRVCSCNRGHLNELVFYTEINGGPYMAALLLMAAHGDGGRKQV